MKRNMFGKMVCNMMDPATAYFLKKYYPHVIKWWLVLYNPEVFRIWPSKAEEEEALRLEEEAKQLALEEAPSLPEISQADMSAYNAATGSYSGLYGQKPVDADTQAALDAIMNTSSNQNTVDSLLSGGLPSTDASYSQNSSLVFDEKKNNFTGSSDILSPPEQTEIIKEANEIYERLLREAAEDEAKKQAEIEEIRRQSEQQFSRQS